MSSSGRRPRARGPQPWLTAALASLCLGFGLWAQHATREVEARSRAALAVASDYFGLHPYLAPPPAVVAHLGAQAIETRRALHQGDLRRRGAAPTPRPLALREQAELDRLAARSEAALEALPARRFGLRASAPEPLAFAGHVLAHAGWLPLAGSLGALLLLGGILEPALGRLAFGLVALGSALASAGLFALANRELAEPLIGTSGLLAGLLGAGAAQGPACWRRPAGAWALLLALGWLLLPHGLGSDWSLAAPPGAGAGASVWALAGGLAFGLLAGLGLRGAAARRRRLPGAAPPAELVRPRLERALQARSEGQLERAFALLGALLREAPDDPDVALALWEVGRELGRNAEAAEALLRVVRGELQRGAADSAIGHWLELRRAQIPVPRDPALLIRLGPLLARAGHEEAARAALRSALEGAERGDATAVSTRVARLARELDPEVAEQAAWRALGSPSLGLDERRSLEALLAALPRARAGAPEPEPPVEAPAAFPFYPGVGPGAGAAPGPAEGPQWVDPRLLADALHSGAGPRAPEAIPASAGPPLEVVEAVPLELAREGLRLEVPGVGKKRLRYAAVGAIGVGAVSGLAREPVILVDLLLDWRAGTRGPLRSVRLRSDRFDARRCLGEGGSASEALQRLIEELLARTGAVPLPDPSAALGLPFARFGDLRAYEGAVLRRGGDDSAGEPLLR